MGEAKKLANVIYGKQTPTNAADRDRRLFTNQLYRQ